MLPLDPHLVDALLPDLVGHDKRPSSFVLYLWLYSMTKGVGRKSAFFSYQMLTTVPAYRSARFSERSLISSAVSSSGWCESQRPQYPSTRLRLPGFTLKPAADVDRGARPSWMQIPARGTLRLREKNLAVPAATHAGFAPAALQVGLDEVAVHARDVAQVDALGAGSLALAVAG